MSQKTLEYLIDQGLVRTVPGNSDYIIVNSFTNPLSNGYTASQTSEYAIKISDFFAAIAADTTAEEVEFNNTSSGLAATNVQDSIDEIAGITTTINISSAQILNMGTNRVELLPTLSSDSFYDIDKITLINIVGTTAYSAERVAIFGAYNATTDNAFLFSGQNKVAFFTSSATETFDDGGDLYTQNASFNTGTNLELTTWSGNNPTTGNGTLRVIINYKIRTITP